MMLKCNNCGRDIKREDRFCPYCGTENLAYKPKNEKLEEFFNAHMIHIIAGACVVVVIVIIVLVKSFARDKLEDYVDLAHYVETNTKPLTAKQMGVSEDYFGDDVKPSKPMKIWEPTQTPRPTPIPTPIHVMTKEEMDALTLPILGKE